MKQSYDNRKPTRDPVHGNYCFQLVGIDVILDNKLKPWLIEVGIIFHIRFEVKRNSFIIGQLHFILKYHIGVIPKIFWGNNGINRILFTCR